MKMGAQRRQVVRLSREQRVLELMAAAREVLAQRGYQETTTAEIAERAGVVEGTIYRYFSNKRDLLLKVVEARYENRIPHYDDFINQISGTRERIRYLVRLNLNFIHNEPQLFSFVSSISREEDYKSTSLYLQNKKYSDVLIGVINTAIQSGELRDDIPPQVARDMIFGCIAAQTRMYLWGRGDFSVDALATSITDLIYDGLAARGADSLKATVARLEAVALRLEQGGSTP